MLVEEGVSGGQTIGPRLSQLYRMLLNMMAPYQENGDERTGSQTHGLASDKPYSHS